MIFERAMAEQAAWSEQRRAAGVSMPPLDSLRHSGIGRTLEKRALLARFRDEA